MTWLWTLILGCFSAGRDVDSSRWTEDLAVEEAWVSSLRVGPDGALSAASWGVFRRGGSGWEILPGSEGHVWRSLAYDTDGTLYATGRNGRVLRGAPGALTVDQMDGVLYDMVSVATAGGRAWVSAAGTEIWTWDGQAWAAEQPDFLANRRLGAVYAPSADTLFAGAQLKATGKAPTVARRAGDVWESWDLGRSGYLGVMGGTSATDVWALGYGARLIGKDGAAWHWDGAAWSETKLPVDRPLYGLHARAPDDAWAAGDRGTLLHWDGAAWTQVPTGLSDNLTGVAVTDDGAIYVIGRGGRVLRREGGA